MQDNELPRKPRKPGSGGARKGTGPKVERKRVTVSMYLFQDVVEWLDGIGGEGYRSNTANMVLDAYMKEDKAQNKPKS